MVTDAPLGWLLVSCALAAWDVSAYYVAFTRKGHTEVGKSLCADQISQLRLRIEAISPSPIVVVVSSALKNDGSLFVARELAASMVSANYSTLLVQDDPDQMKDRILDNAITSINDVSDLGVAHFLSDESLRDANMHLLRIAKLSKSSLEDIYRFIDTCRRSYRVTVINAGCYSDSMLGMLRSSTADGVVLAFREGRRVCGADRQLSESLARSNVPVIGLASVAAPLLRGESGADSRARQDIDMKAVPATLRSTARET